MSVEVQITDLDDVGLGCATTVVHEKERRVRIFGALPGEKISIDEPLHTRKTRRPAISLPGMILEPSLMRVPAKCPHVGYCGGCLVQHMDYDEQLRWKNERIATLFAPLVDQETQFFPCLGSEDLWLYRNKMEFSFSQDAALKRFLGLHSLTRSRRIETVQECHIGPVWSTEMLARLYAWWGESGLRAYHPYQDIGSLRTVTFRSSKRTRENMVILTVSGRPEWALSKDNCRSLVEAILPMEEKYGVSFSCVVRIQQAIKGHPTQWYEMVLHGKGELHERYTIENFGEVELQFSPQSFQQPNSRQAERIYSSALTMLRLHPYDVLWDLFCGVGGFGLIAAPFVHKAVGIELSPDSAYDASCNKARLERENFQIEKGDVFEIVSSPEAMMRVSKPSKVVVDPPRSGLGPKVVELLHSIAPRLIAYVSCNPESQFRDVQMFHEKGWRVQCVQSIDQFPHTHHLENIVLLKHL